MLYNVIAIEREYASGGREIGEKLAARLGIPSYGQEILKEAADRVGLSLDEAGELEESMTGSLLFSLHMYASVLSGKGGDLTKAQKLAFAQADVVREAALHPCVIIGRSAAGLLRDHDNALKVFIYSDVRARIRRAVEVYGLAPEHAESALRRLDRRRAGYFKSTAGVGWHDADAYHMFFNSGKLGIDPVVEALYTSANFREGGV